MDDRTAGLVIRALRRRRGWRQVDLADRAGTSRSAVSRAEHGWIDQLTLRSIRRILAALEARVELAPRWKGAELERLLDERHATVVAVVARRLERLGWTVVLEVTYSEYGERGSIDVLGLRPEVRAAVVIEVKTDLASSEAVGRKLDEKTRLAPEIVRARFGWQPATVGRLLVMPDTMRLRRLVQKHDVLTRMFPVDAAAVRRWLREPRGPFAGLWFLSDSHQEGTGDASTASKRQIAPGARSAPAREAPPQGPNRPQTSRVTG